MIWVKITNGHSISKSEVDGVFTWKIPKDWSYEETKIDMLLFEGEENTHFHVKHKSILLYLTL